MTEFPPRDVQRWTAGRKAAVVAAVEFGEITKDAACARWAISTEELTAWIRDWDRHGLAGLRVTRLDKRARRGPWRTRKVMF